MFETEDEPASRRPIAVVTTLGSLAEARAMASSLVSRGLAACVQIETIESVYRWQGAVQAQTEFRVLAKTVAGRYDAVEAAIRELHSYELPAIHAIAFEHAYGPYADWIADGSAGD